MMVRNADGNPSRKSKSVEELMIARRERTTRNYDLIRTAAGEDAKDLVATAITEFDSSRYASFVVGVFANLAGRIDSTTLKEAAFVLHQTAEIRSEYHAVAFAKKISQAKTAKEVKELIRPFLED